VQPVKLFLSYASEDESQVEHLYNLLTEDGYKPWMAKRDIVPGEDWENAIWKAVREADLFVVCLSNQAVAKRGFLQKEIKQALEIWKGKLEDDIYLIPLRLETCPAPSALARFQWIDFFLQDGHERLKDAISRGIERLKHEELMAETADRPAIVAETIMDKDAGGVAYDITVKYPQLRPAVDLAVKELNARLAGFAVELVQRFRAESLAALDYDRESRLQHNLLDALDTHFEVPLFTHEFFSVRFGLGTYHAGAMHPNSHTQTLNFLLRPVRELRFINMFIPRSDYLGVVSEYCIEALHGQAAAERNVSRLEYGRDEWIVKGAGPNHNNFDACVLTKAGMLIVFDPYQVGSYAEGRREVLIPYDVLRGVMKSDVLSVVEGLAARGRSGCFSRSDLSGHEAGQLELRGSRRAGMAVPCHELTENQRRYREKERKKRAAGALEPARLAHAHDLAQDQAQIERSGMNQEPLQNIGVARKAGNQGKRRRRSGPEPPNATYFAGRR
jgi:hypothetical protein